MKISARVQSGRGTHRVFLRSNDHVHAINIPPQATGFGSSVNGGELLFLALATCYCNDVFRAAGRLNITVHSVEVEVAGEFAAEGEPNRGVTYRAKIAAKAPEAQLRDLLYEVDRIAEVHATLRAATPVTLEHVEVLAG